MIVVLKDVLCHLHCSAIVVLLFLIPSKDLNFLISLHVAPEAFSLLLFDVE